jgi:hypothetical protein
MRELENITKEIPSSTLSTTEKENTFPFDEITAYLKQSLDIDDYNTFVKGMVKQKNNKRIDILKIFLELVYNDVNEINSIQTNGDKSFFNVNKKILLSNLQNSYEILKMYNVCGDKILYTLLGTLIQYIYETKQK